MQKLKKVFSPGNDKDDETMYGSPSARKAHAESSPVDQATTSPTTTGTSSGKDHGISRQILNPGGDKYDEQRFGTSTSGQPQMAHRPEERAAALEDRMGGPKEDRGVKRQVLDPSSSITDEAGYGATGFNPASASHGSSVRPDHSTAGSALSMKSGVLGSPDQKTEERALHSDGITSQGRSDEPTNFSRNAALTGAAAAGAGGAYAATRPGDNTTEHSHTDRSFPLSGGAVAPHNDNRPTSSVYSAERPEPVNSSSGVGYVPGLNTGTAGGTGESSGEAALESLGLGRHNIIDHNGHSHEFNGDPCEVEPAEKTLAHIPGPHATVAANMLDPHVPGEFPADDGFDPHGSHNLAAQTREPSSEHHYGRDAALAGGAGGAGLGAHEALKDESSPAQHASSPPSSSSGIGYPAPLGSHEALADRTLPAQQPAYSSTNEDPSSEKHHYGRDAALAGGAGAAGLGAYEATRGSEPTAPQQSRGLSAPDPSTSQSRVSQPIARNQSPQHVAGNPLTGARDPQQEHHYGRDAALAGGAGAAGLGANQYLNDRNTSDPVSTGASPQDARDNIVTEPTTGLPMNVGKYGPGTGGTDASRPIASHYNDSPVVSDHTQAQQPLSQDKEHHYGRDAALAGGAGAAGLGAYEYAKDRGETDPTAIRTSEPYSSTADPRAQPAATGYAPATTSTPNQSKTLDKADPRAQTHAQHAQQIQEAPPAQDEHHYGRDAAVAGGAGAAGAAGYAALQDDRNDTGPASKTIGPHKSNIANIVDPRVRPEPEKMKDHTTSGPWQSDTLNKMDPKVESDPRKADVKAHGYASSGPTTLPVQQQQQQQQQAPVDQDKDHHYGRDAAVVGGAGAAAYGADQAYDKHEQEKLAKEQEKQAQHDAKERAKEQEKQAKHDAKEQEKQAKHDQKEADKQAKHDAHEAEKARKKEEEKHAKEQEKLEKHHAKEQEKAEEKRLKEQEKAEEKRQKEAEKLQHEKEKEDAKLNSARYDEAEAKHNQHNKLHKPAPEERDEKGGILHRIFHHKHYERDGVEGSSREGGSFEHERPTGLNDGNVGEEAFGREGVPSSTTGQTAGEQSALGKSSFEQPGLGGEGDGMVTESTTGLPMNVGKYGHTGGTDANEAITGHYAK